MECEHKNFVANAKVARLTEVEDGPVKKYMLDITVNCEDCGKPFHFIGVEPGLSPDAPRISVNGVELRAPIVPGEGPIIAGGSYYT